MAVTKIWAIKDSLQRVLDYAANPDKTEYDALAQTLHYAENDAKTKLNESAQLVTGIHCRADHAWEDMRTVQERFGKTDGVVALHAYQSFREGEVTPEQCHEIGVALARKVWGKRFQVLVATHMNTDNLLGHVQASTTLLHCMADGAGNSRDIAKLLKGHGSFLSACFFYPTAEPPKTQRIFFFEIPNEHCRHIQDTFYPTCNFPYNSTAVLKRLQHSHITKEAFRYGTTEK